MSAPSSTEFNEAIQIYAVCTLALYVKYIVSLFLGVDFSTRPPEDQNMIVKHGEEKKDDVLNEESAGTSKINQLRRNRVAANDLENIPIQLTIFWAALFVQTFANSNNNGKQATKALSSLIIIYTFGRIGHSVSYYFALQPARSIFFIAALMSSLAAVVILVISSFQVDTSLPLL